MTKAEKQQMIEEIIDLNPYWIDSKDSRETLNEFTVKELEKLHEYSCWTFRDRYR